VAPNAEPFTAGTTTGRASEHAIVVSAPPEVVYALLVDAEGWPQIFGPTIHAETEAADTDTAAVDDADTGAGEESLRLWAYALRPGNPADAAGLADDGRAVHTWTSRRTLDPAAGTICFRQVVTSPPVAAMSGQWLVVPDQDGGSRVTLTHEFRAQDGPQALAYIERAVDRNSRAELQALKTAAEIGPAIAELRFSFHDSVHIDGRAEDVFEFLDRADRWPGRLPHVTRVELTERQPGLQHLDMDTSTSDGGTHNTTSVRVCFPDRRLIVYKQLRVPVALSGHTGRWTIEEDPAGGVRATSWHTVTLDPEGVRHMLGPGVDFAEARDTIRTAISGNSSSTLRHAKDAAEAAYADRT
jgi:aromatase